MWSSVSGYVGVKLAYYKSRKRSDVLFLAAKCGQADEWYFLWGYYGTQYRVRFYPPFGD